MTIRSGGSERAAVYYIPSSYTGNTAVPVVFDFHGSNSNSDGQLDRSGWDGIAEENGFIVVALQGSLDGELPGTHAWNVPGVTVRPGGLDEAGFIRDAVAMVKADFCVDPARVYASGYSGGGRMLSQYLCSGANEFPAAGFVASLRAGLPRQIDGAWGPDAESCAPSGPISIIAFAGTRDPANPYQGGGKAYWQYGGVTALKRWAELDGCKGGVKSEPGERVTFNSYDMCKGGARIYSYVISDWDHSWPSSIAKVQLIK